MNNLFVTASAARLHYRIALLVEPKHGELAADALRCCAYDLHLWLRKKNTRPATDNPERLLLEASFDALPEAATQFMQKLCAYSDVFPISLIRLDLLDASLLKMQEKTAARTANDDLCMEIAWRRSVCGQV